MYLPYPIDTEPLDWEWDTINYQVICTPDGPQQQFVEYLVGWGRPMEKWQPPKAAE